MKVGPYLTSYTKIKKFQMDQKHRKSKCLHPLEHNEGEYLYDLGIGKEFLNKTCERKL